MISMEIKISGIGINGGHGGFFLIRYLFFCNDWSGSKVSDPWKPLHPLACTGVIIFQIAPTQVGAEFYKLGCSGQNLYNFGTILVQFLLFFDKKLEKNPKIPEIL